MIVGDKEMEDGTVNVRRYGQKETNTVSVDEFVATILADIANKSRVEKIKRSQSEKHFSVRKSNNYFSCCFLYFV